VADVLARNPGLELYLTYGLTEAGPRVATLAAHLAPSGRYASVGLPLPGVAVHLRKENPSDEVGELVVETDTGVLRPIGGRSVPATSADGTRKVISTGDLFAMDEDGYLFFRGRGPSYVMIRGEKVCMKSVCEVAESIGGVARAEAWTFRTATGDLALALDVYCKARSVTENEIRRQLGQVLLRSELPTQLVLHADAPLQWRKTIA
jgi:long-chain acyl-CoA synthetase